MLEVMLGLGLIHLPGLVLAVLLVFGSGAVTIVGVGAVAVVDFDAGTGSGVVGGGGGEFWG